MVERQSAHTDRLHAGGHPGHDRRIPGFGLQHIGNHIAMQQHRPLGDAGGAPGVLQHRHIIGFGFRALKAGLGAPCQCLVEAHGAGQAKWRHHLLDLAHHVVHQGALQGAELVAHGTQHHVFDRRGGQAFLEGAGKVFDDDNRLRAAVFELVFQLARRVERVDIHDHHAGSQNACYGHRVLRHIGHHEGDPIASGQTQALQVSGKRLAQAIGLRIRDVHTHKAVSHRPGMLAKALFHQAHQGAVERGVYLGRHTCGIAAKPNAFRHVFCLHPCLRTPTPYRTGVLRCKVQPLSNTPFLSKLPIHPFVFSLSSEQKNPGLGSYGAWESALHLAPTARRVRP